MAQFKRVDPAALFAQSFQGLRKFDRDLLKLFSDLVTSLGNMFDRGITFDENTETQTLDYTTNATPDTEDTVAHTLNKVPTGFFVAGMDKAATIYNGATAWTSTHIYLKCNVASVAARIMVF